MPMHTQQAAPVMPPKEKKTLTITDKQGNVIDLKTGKPVSEAEVDVEGATTKMSSLHVAKTDAGSSLRKAAEEAIKAGGAKKLKEEAERKKLEEEEEAKKKAEEEAAVSGFTLLLVCLQYQACEFDSSKLCCISCDTSYRKQKKKLKGRKQRRGRERRRNDWKGKGWCCVLWSFIRT